MSNPDKFKFLQLKHDKDQSALLARVWGRCEKARWISRCHYRCSLHRSEKRGVIMVTRGAVYIYRRKLLKGFRLRYCFSPLKCFAIEQSQNVVIFTLPPPGVKQGSAEEVRAGIDLLRALGLRKNEPMLVSCPTCGRTGIDLIGIAAQVEERLRKVHKPITVAVMGCVVNGPGEAREAGEDADTQSGGESR